MQKVSMFLHRYRRHMQTPKHWYQRARYGVSFRDAWSLDCYLSDVISRGAGIIRKNDIGHPSDLTSEEWQEVLDEIIDCFSSYDEIFEVGEGAENRMDKVNRGLDLLKEHYFDLWD